MPLRSNNTFSEQLQKLLGTIADMKTMPDADLEWLVNLETMVLQKVREPIDAMQQQGATQVPGDPSMAGMGLPPMPGGGPTMAPPPVPGIRTEPNMPNPDELRRVMGAASQ